MSQVLSTVSTAWRWNPSLKLPHASRQEERFTGLFVPLFKKSLDRDTRRGFEEMNLA